VHIAELLGSLLWVSDIEVVVACLPEVQFCRLLQNFRSALFQYLQRCCERRGTRFSDEEMYVLGHESVSGDDELKMLAHSIELVLEDGVSAGSREKRKPVITTEGDEVETAGFLNAR